MNNIYKEIEQYLNKKIIKNYKEIIKEVSKILGIKEEYIESKLKHFFPIYTINRKSLCLALNIDFDKLPVNDLRLITYLLDQTKEDKLYLGGLSKNNKSAILLLQKTSQKLIMPFNYSNNNLEFYYENEIYQGSLSCDLKFIKYFLLFLGVSKINNSYSFCTKNVNFENNEYIYSELITQLSILITSNLHKNNIYLFDNKYLSQTPDTMNNSIEEYFKKFYTLFSDIIHLLILDYKKFISYLGEDNFILFAHKIKNNELEDIDSLINTMYKNLIEYRDGIIVDIKTITKAIKRGCHEMK